jgi:integrase
VADVWKRKGRKSKPWVADFNGPDGRRHRLSAATKEDAQDLLSQKRKEAREIGPTIGDREITIRAYAETWLPHIEPDLKHASTKAYAYCLRAHILPAFGSMKVRDLSRLHVKWFIDEKRKAELAKATIAHLRAVLSAMLGDAVEDNIITQNPVMAMRRRKRRTTKGQSNPAANIRPLSEAEVAALLDHTREPQLRTLFLLLVRAGVRPGEARALQWSDFDFTARQILVERNLYDGKLDSPKSGASRKVDMSLMLAEALSALYVQREREKLAGEFDEIPDWVFCRNGEWLRHEYVSYHFERSMRRAGISGHVLYDLRHTYASQLIARAPITYVAQQMGHADANITLKYYARWIPSADRSFVDSLDKPTTVAPLFGTTQEKAKHFQGNLAENQLLLS